MNELRGERDHLIRIGYEAPVRKSLIDPHRMLECPRLPLLGWTMLCGLVFLWGLPEIAAWQGMDLQWKVALGCTVVLWIIGVVLMAAYTRRDPQFLEVAWMQAQRSGGLHLG